MISHHYRPCNHWWSLSSGQYLTFCTANVNMYVNLVREVPKEILEHTIDHIIYIWIANSTQLKSCRTQTNMISSTQDQLDRDKQPGQRRRRAVGQQREGSAKTGGRSTGHHLRQRVGPHLPRHPAQPRQGNTFTVHYLFYPPPLLDLCHSLAGMYIHVYTYMDTAERFLTSRRCSLVGKRRL